MDLPNRDGRLPKVPSSASVSAARARCSAAIASSFANEISPFVFIFAALVVPCALTPAPAPVPVAGHEIANAGFGASIGWEEGVVAGVGAGIGWEEAAAVDERSVVLGAAQGVVVARGVPVARGVLAARGVTICACLPLLDFDGASRRGPAAHGSASPSPLARTSVATLPSTSALPSTVLVPVLSSTLPAVVLHLASLCIRLFRKDIFFAMPDAIPEAAALENVPSLPKEPDLMKELEDVETADEPGHLESIRLRSRPPGFAGATTSSSSTGAQKDSNSEYWSSPSPLTSNSEIIDPISSSLSGAPPPGRFNTALSSSAERDPLPSRSNSLNAACTLLSIGA